MFSLLKILSNTRIYPGPNASATELNGLSTLELLCKLSPKQTSIEADTGNKNVPVASSQHEESLPRTHDIEGCMRTGIDLLLNTPSEELTAEEKNALSLELFKEGLALCSDLKKSILSNSVFRKQTNPLTSKQLTALQNLEKMQELSGIILLADDSLINLKMVLNRLKIEIKSFENLHGNTQIAFTNCLKEIDADEWRYKRLIIEHIGPWAIVCAANGEVAFDITKQCTVLAMITDHEMPGMEGVDLIKAIRATELSERRIPMSIILNTALTKETMIELGINIEDANLVYLHKGMSSTDVFKTFWNSVVNFRQKSVDLHVLSSNEPSHLDTTTGCYA